MALCLGMNQYGFAAENGRNDTILEESWRRTWWQIYATDAHIAGGTYTYPYQTSYMEIAIRLLLRRAELRLRSKSNRSYSSIFTVRL